MEQRVTESNSHPGHKEMKRSYVEEARKSRRTVVRNQNVKLRPYGKSMLQHVSHQVEEILRGTLFEELESKPLLLFYRDAFKRMKELREIDEQKKEELIGNIKELQQKLAEKQ